MNSSTFEKLMYKYTQDTPIWAMDDAMDKKTWFEQHIKSWVSTQSGLGVKLEAYTTNENWYSFNKKDLKYKNQNMLALGSIHLLGSASAAYASEYYKNNHRLLQRITFKIDLYVLESKDKYIAIRSKRKINYQPSDNDSDQFRYFKNEENFHTLIIAVRNIMQKKIFNIQKTLKVKELQFQAINAQLEQIAKKENFSYDIEIGTHIIVIYISLSKKSYMRISIPFSNFDNILPDLCDTVRKLCKLSQKGIRLKMHS